MTGVKGGELPNKKRRALQRIQQSHRLKAIAKKAVKAEPLVEIEKQLVSSKAKTTRRNNASARARNGC